ncbi:MAG TPA: GNAT family N-acetyltransferase, partial [Hyphomicrobiales bacterium]|nr:GNAT family N-acetyltransferase [Hyphomicrobiales bacterium]
ILGLVVLQFAAGEAEILSIAVRKDSRQSGVGSSLLAGAISFCEEMRVSHLYLEVAEANHPALTLYKKFGFQIFGVRKNYYLNEAEQSHNAFVMRLTIGAGRGKR